MNKKQNVLPVMIALVLVASLVINCLPIYAENAGTSANVLNSAPTVDVELTPDDDPATPGVQVINPDPSTNKTVTITAAVTDMNGYDDLTGDVVANITGPSVVEDSPVSLSFDSVIGITTVTYTGSFNMSNHLEGDYKVEVKATDKGGLTGVGSRNFSYLYAATEIGGPEAKAMTNIPGTDIYTTNTTAAVGTSPGTYYLPVNATDNSPNRNSNTSVSIPLTVLPAEVVTTYDFTTGAGSDKWAFRKQHNTKPPAANDVPNIVFTSAQYNKIKVNDGTYQVDTSSRRGYYAIHRFKFDIAEPESSITKLDILWDGAGYIRWGTRGATLYIWNFETGAYEQLDRKTNKKVTLERTIADNIGDYIDDDGSLIIIAEQNSAQWRFWRWTFRSRLGTDYVKVDVTYTPKPYLDGYCGGEQDRYEEEGVLEVVIE
jgi:hypothetical protein